MIDGIKISTCFEFESCLRVGCFIKKSAGFLDLGVEQIFEGFLDLSKLSVNLNSFIGLLLTRWKELKIAELI